MFWDLIAILVIMYAIHYYFYDHTKNAYYIDIHQIQKDFVAKAFKEKDLTSMTLIVLWAIGSLTIFVVLVAAYHYVDDRVKLLTAFAILLSAFMASVAMMKSIKHNDETKKAEIEIEKSKSNKLLIATLLRLHSFVHAFNENKHKKVIFLSPDKLNAYSEFLYSNASTLSDPSIYDLLTQKEFYALLHIIEAIEVTSNIYTEVVNNMTELSPGNKFLAIKNMVQIENLIKEFTDIPITQDEQS